MIKYIKKLPTLIKSLALAFYSYFDLHDKAEGYTYVTKKNDFSYSNNLKNKTPSEINAQRIAYWSGSSKNFRG